MAEAVASGIESVPGVSARIRTVPEVCAVNGMAPTAHGREYPPLHSPVYATHEDLDECIGLALGSPTRFGNMAAPLKYFLDTTSGPWTSGALSGKPACVFTTAASQHAGHESTLLTMMVPLLHHGMIIVGCPYTEPALNKTTTGGTPYGPSHFSGGQSNLPLSADETAIAFAVGKRLAQIALALLEQRET